MGLLGQESFDNSYPSRLFVEISRIAGFLKKSELWSFHEGRNSTYTPNFYARYYLWISHMKSKDMVKGLHKICWFKMRTFECKTIYWHLIVWHQLSSLQPSGNVLSPALKALRTNPLTFLDWKLISLNHIELT